MHVFWWAFWWAKIKFLFKSCKKAEKDSERNKLLKRLSYAVLWNIAKRYEKI